MAPKTISVHTHLIYACESSLIRFNADPLLNQAICPELNV